MMGIAVYYLPNWMDANEEVFIASFFALLARSTATLAAKSVCEQEPEVAPEWKPSGSSGSSALPLIQADAQEFQFIDSREAVLDARLLRTLENTIGDRYINELSVRSADDVHNLLQTLRSARLRRNNHIPNQCWCHALDRCLRFGVTVTPQSAAHEVVSSILHFIEVELHELRQGIEASRSSASVLGPGSPSKTSDGMGWPLLSGEMDAGTSDVPLNAVVGDLSGSMLQPIVSVPAEQLESLVMVLHTIATQDMPSSSIPSAARGALDSVVSSCRRSL